MERRRFTPEQEKIRMEEGKLYWPGEESIMKDQAECQEMMYDYNATRPSQGEKRWEYLQKMFAEIGEGTYIEVPFRANWGGRNVHIGKDVYANFNLMLVDDGEIFIGDGTMIGPNVTIATASHPILPELREAQYQYNLPVHVGKNVWIGAGAILLPGVSVGDNTVIGAGSVVTKDIPADVVAVGNPCKVLREIGEKDRKYYYKDREIDL